MPGKPPGNVSEIGSGSVPSILSDCVNRASAAYRGEVVMPLGLEPIRSSSISRPIYILSIFLVFCYVSFDVLDLDGSDFPKLFTSVQRTITAALLPSSTELNYSSESWELCGDKIFLPVDRSAEYGRQSWAELLRASLLGTARSHGYRVGLARNSLPDSSPYF